MSSLPILSGAINALSRMAEEQVPRHSLETHKAEMLEVAVFVCAAYARGAEVKVAVEPYTGYRLSSPVHTAGELSQIAQVLSQVSSYSVEYRSGRSPRAKIEPLACGVIIPHAPNTMGARTYIARNILSLLEHTQTSPSDDLSRQEEISGALSSLQEIIACRLNYRASGMPELIVDADFTKLADPRLIAGLRGLGDALPDLQVKFLPEQGSIIRAFREIIGSQAAWTIETKKMSNRVIMVDTHGLDKEFIAQSMDLLRVRFGVPFNVEYQAPRAEVFFSPQTQNAEREPYFSAPPFLQGVLAQPKDDSNIFTLTVPYSSDNPRIRDLISKSIDTNDFFVRVISSATQSYLTAQTLKPLLSDLAENLDLKFIECIADGRDSLAINLPPLQTIRDLEALAVFLTYLDTMTPLSRVALQVNLHRPSEDMFSFFAQTIGHAVDWRFEEFRDRVVVYSRTPEVFSERIKELFKVVFDQPLVVVREPEGERGIMIVPPSRCEQSGPTRELDPVDMNKVFPSVFGQEPFLRREGNRIIAYAQVRNLPKSYLSHLSGEFYGVACPVIIREDSQAQLIGDTRLLEDVAYRSLPKGCYLREVAESDASFNLSVSIVDEKSRPALRTMARELSQCCAKRIRIKEMPVTEAFFDLLQTTLNETDRRYFSRVIDSQDRVLDYMTLKEKFLDFFHADVQLPGHVARSYSTRERSFRDLTRLESFSIDKDGTYFCEDAFSVERLSHGGYRFWIHVVSAPSSIPYGSPADVVARRRGGSSKIEGDVENHSLRLFSHYNNQLLDLSLKRESFTFSLSFETDARFQILPDRYDLSLARIRNRERFSHSSIDDAPHPVREEIQWLSGFARRHLSQGYLPTSGGGQIPAQKIVQTLLSVFNAHVGQTLREADIPLPPANQSTLSTTEVDKFTSPARSFVTLLRQRQLYQYLIGEPPLSESVIREHLERVGVAANKSSAFVLFDFAQAQTRNSPERRIVLTKNGEFKSQERMT